MAATNASPDLSWKRCFPYELYLDWLFVGVGPIVSFFPCKALIGSW